MRTVSLFKGVDACVNETMIEHHTRSTLLSKREYHCSVQKKRRRREGQHSEREDLQEQITMNAARTNSPITTQITTNTTPKVPPFPVPLLVDTDTVVLKVGNWFVKF